MNLALSKSSAPCWRSGQCNWNRRTIIQWTRLSWFAGFFLAFLLTGAAHHVVAQSQQPAAVTVSQGVQEAVDKNTEGVVAMTDVEVVHHAPSEADEKS